jgi:hypothetical protein
MNAPFNIVILRQEIHSRRAPVRAGGLTAPGCVLAYRSPEVLAMPQKANEWDPNQRAANPSPQRDEERELADDEEDLEDDEEFDESDESEDDEELEEE